MSDPNAEKAAQLAELAAYIRRLSRRVTQDIIWIGRCLTEAKKIAGHGGWLPWLKDLGWRRQTAESFMLVAARATKFPNFGNLKVPVSALYLLARKDTPVDVIDEIAERSAKGERVSLAQVQKAVAAAHPRKTVRLVSEKRDDEEERVVVPLRPPSVNVRTVTLEPLSVEELIKGGHHFQAIVGLLDKLTDDELNQLAAIVNNRVTKEGIR